MSNKAAWSSGNLKSFISPFLYQAAGALYVWLCSLRWSALICVASIAGVWFTFGLCCVPHAPYSPPRLTAIEWRSRGDNFECGHLTVPLDYTNNSDQRTATLALVRYLATDSENRMGSLVIEPGGPGAPGTLFTYLLGKPISEIVEGRYDIVGFDPRGINLSTPPISCFLNSSDRELYQRWTKKLPSSGPGVMAELDAWNEVLGRGCELMTGDSLAYVSTAFVARDLDRIADALGEQTLHYWGLSYGTSIGATFTAMFPHRVGRFVLDACLHPEDGRSALQTAESMLEDTDKTFKAFLEACMLAGASRCSLVRSSGETVVDLQAKIEGLLLSLEERPFAVSRRSKPGIVDKRMLLDFILALLYRPNTWWPLLADVLDALLTRQDGSVLLDMIESEAITKEEEGYAVLCSDALPAMDISIEEWEEQAIRFRKKSFISGEIRATWAFTCRQWRGRAKERYLGKFNKSLANPVLLIGGTHDPATPLSNARRLAKDMGENARLIVHHGFGHESLRHRSACTEYHIRNVFLNGVLPEDAETHCLPTEELFPPRMSPGK